MRTGRHHNGRRHCFFQCFANRVLIGTFLNFDQHAGVRKIRDSSMRQENKSVMIGVRHDLLAGNGVFRGQCSSANDKVHRLAGDIERYCIAELQYVRLGKLFLDHTALNIRWGKHDARTEIGPVQFEIPFVDFQRGFHIVAHVFHIHCDGRAALGRRHSGRMTDSVKILP